MTSKILRLPCASRPGTDFIEINDHGEYLGITVKDTIQQQEIMTIVLDPEQVDEVIDFLSASRAGPLGKLAFEASKKEKT